MEESSSSEGSLRVIQYLLEPLRQIKKELVQLIYNKTHRLIIKLILKSLRQKLVNSIIVESRFTNVPKICVQNCIRAIKTFLQQNRKIDIAIEPVYIPSSLFSTEEAVIMSFVRALGIQELKESPEMHLLQIERQIRESKRYLILVMEDIDKYLVYGRQNFIYKILNMFQTSHLPFIFIATTSVPDVVDLFEKRVKSRFSSYQILMQEEKESFQIGMSLWQKKTIQRAQQRQYDFIHKQKAINLINPKVRSQILQIKKANKSFFAAYQMMVNSITYFMTVAYQINAENPQFDIGDYLQTLLTNLPDYIDQVNSLRSPDKILRSLTSRQLLILLVVMRQTVDSPKQFEQLYIKNNQLFKDHSTLNEMSSNDYKVALLHLNVLGLIKVSKGFLPGSKSDASFGGVQRKWFSKACFVSRVQKKDIDEEFQKTKFTHFQRKVFKHIKQT